MSKRLAKLVDRERVDNRERIECLRLQATAWRQIAMIATTDPARGAELAQWLLFNSVPFVNGPVVEKLIAETEQDAVASGTASGVFTNRAA